ncbi:hypothetical protein ACWC9R_12065 [Streptomyces sp. NPDC001219]
MPDLPAPSSTGVRIAGDRYQWLVAWQGCVTAVRDAALHAPNPVVAVGVEVDGVGNVDDVVLYRKTPPHTYMQVKYAADSSTPVNEDYLLKLSDQGGPSILRKLAQAWQQLTEDNTPVDLALLSNRSPDAEDPLISLRDSRTQLLVPKAAQQGRRSKKGQARGRWAEGAGLSEEELLGLLKVLRFDLARDVMHLHEHLRMLMVATGLRFDEEAMHAGADWVARQVADGQRQLSLADVKEAIRSLRLEVGSSGAVVSVATAGRASVATTSNIVEVLACTVEWINAPLLPFPSKLRLRELVEDALGEVDQGNFSYHRRDSDTDGTLLVFFAAKEEVPSLAQLLLRRFDDLIRRDWAENEYRNIRPQIRIFMHFGLCRSDSNGECTGALFDEMEAQRVSMTLQDALNTDDIGVIACMSDSAFLENADPVRQNFGEWVSCVNLAGDATPMKIWFRAVPPRAAPKCLLIASLTASGDFEIVEEAVAQMESSLESLQGDIPQGLGKVGIEVGKWSKGGISVAVLSENSASFLVGYLLPLMAKRLLMLGNKRAIDIRMHAGVHTVKDRVQEDDSSFVVAARLAKWAQKVRAGIQESGSTTVCLVSTYARSSAPDNLMDFVDPTRYTPLPQEGLEDSVDAWLYVPYEPKF